MLVHTQQIFSVCECGDVNKQSPGWRQQASDLDSISCQSAFATVHCANWVVRSNSAVSRARHRELDNGSLTTRWRVCAFLYIHRKTRWSHWDLMRLMITSCFIPTLFALCFFFKSCMTSSSPSHVSLFPLPSNAPHSIHHLPIVLSIFSTQLAPTPDTAQRHPHKCPHPGSPSLTNKNAFILWLHSAKSGWVRAACRNSCSGSDQKKERDFFDYYLFVCPPLKLSYSLGPLSEWAASQGNN